MNVQESNILQAIKVEKFESLFFDEPNAIIIPSKVNEREIKDEYFDVPESIAHADIIIKAENQEENQSHRKYFDPDYKGSHKTFTCKYCYIGLSAEEYKNVHERRCKLRNKEHLGGSVFGCSYCKLLYTMEGDKNEHQAICKKKKGSEKCEETATRKDERKYCCDKCNYETQWKSCLVRHTRMHDKVNAPKYACNQCPFQTIRNSHLKMHLRTHSGFGLICVLCQKSFKRKGSLDAHYIAIHPDRSDEWGSTITHKINECPKCLYKTVNTGNFKVHLAAHGTTEDETQFKCNFCGFKCVWKSSFMRHLRVHVGQVPFVCTECDKRFSRKAHLDDHIISQHSENEDLINSVTSKVHQCDKCDYRTVQNSHFKRHLKTCL